MKSWLVSLLEQNIIILDFNYICKNILSPNPTLREGDSTPLQYSCLENPMEGGAWWASVHGVAKRWTRLSDFTFTFHFPALEKAMAPHSSVLAWRIPGTGEPGGLPSVGSHRVGHDWSDLAAAAAAACNLHHSLTHYFWSMWNKVERKSLCSDFDSEVVSRSTVLPIALSHLY